MSVRLISLIAIAVGMMSAVSRVGAATPHPALPAKPVAAFVQATAPKKAPAKILYYKNADVLKTTAVTVRTPVYATVTTPIYSTVKTPILDAKGKVTGYKTAQVQTGTTTSQRITSYTSVTTKSTAITPKTELYTTNGTTTAPGAAAVKFSLDVASASWATRLNGLQDAMFTFSATSTQAPILYNGLFAQMFDTGTLSFTRATPLYRLDALGHAVGPALSNLLTVTFENALLTSTQNGTTIGFAASTPVSALTFSSDFRQFTKSDWLSNFDFALAGDAASTKISRAAVDATLTNVTGTRSLNSFRVTTTGTFAASDVPEPASWSLMILGFGAIGFARRADVRKLALARV